MSPIANASSVSIRRPVNRKILCPRRADELDQSAWFSAWPGTRLKPLGGDREVRVGDAEPEVAGEREAKPAPDRDAADHREGRTIEIHQRPRGPSWSASP